MSYRHVKISPSNDKSGPLHPPTRASAYMLESIPPIPLTIEVLPVDPLYHPTSNNGKIANTKINL